MPLKTSLESLLLVSPKPLTIQRLAKALAVEPDAIAQTINELAQDYEQRGSGFSILTTGPQVQLVTSGKSSDVVKQFLNEEQTGELTRPALETLTIIVYRPPIRKSELELIRGVNCSLILRNLLIRGLIEEEKDGETGEPCFRPSAEFLKWLGVSRVEDLPDFERLSSAEILKDLLKPETSKP